MGNGEGMFGYTGYWEVIASRKHFSILSTEEEMLKSILSCEEKGTTYLEKSKGLNASHFTF